MALYEVWEKLGKRQKLNNELGQAIVTDIDQMIDVHQQTIDKLRGQREAVIASFQQMDADLTEVFGAPPQVAQAAE
jgi:hypothetical protein